MLSATTPIVSWYVHDSHGSSPVGCYSMLTTEPQLSTPTPHFTSPTSPEFAIDYPKILPDSLAFKFPPISEREDRASPVEEYDELDDTDDSFADTSFESIDSGLATPSDEHGAELGTLVSKTYHIEGAEEEGAYAIDRTIIRAGSRSRFDLSRSLGKLRSMPSFSSFARSANVARSDSGSGTSTPPDAEPNNSSSDGIAAPPASLLASRRPSLATGSLAPSSSLSSPVSAHEVMRNLRKIASTLNLRDCAGPGVERHFEETVDYYEKAWPLDGALEVHVTRTEETVVRRAEGDEDYLVHAQGYVLSDGVGLYAAPPVRSRKTTLRAVTEEAHGLQT